jgi:hypothetical protein
MKPGRAVYLLSWSAVIVIAAGCGREGVVERSPETLAVEETAGDFIDYYGTVLHLATRYASHPDSFRAALDSLPGSHLTDEQWAAWTAPYREHPSLLADRLEEKLAEVRAR